MPTRRKYSPTERARVAGIAAIVGVTEAERQTGIAKETIQYWTRDPSFAELRTTARAIVLEQWWAGIQVGATELIKGMGSDAPLRDKAAAWSALTDRFALLSGEATARTEHVDNAPDNLDLSGARSAYLAVLPGGSGAVGGRNGTGPASNGHAALPALSLPDEAHGGRVASKADPESTADGHQPDRGNRGEVAS